MQNFYPPSILGLSADIDLVKDEARIVCETDGPLPNRGSLRVTLDIGKRNSTPAYQLRATFNADGSNWVEAWSASDGTTRSFEGVDGQILHNVHHVTFEFPASVFDWSFAENLGQVQVQAAFETAGSNTVSRASASALLHRE